MSLKSDFIEWRTSLVTRTVFNIIEGQIKDRMFELSHSAGDDPIVDARRTGYIAALRSVLLIEYDEVEDHVE